MFHLRRLGHATACALMLGLSAAAAETPQDSLVMAFQIDDLITLDPAEVFEFTGAEYAANVYDRLVTYPPDAVEDLRGPRRRELGDRRRRQDLHVPGARRHHLPQRPPAHRRGCRLVARPRDQAEQPQIRSCQEGPFKRASWDQAMVYLVKRFHDIIDEHGPDAVAFYGSGQLTTEEYYIANKLGKGFLGTNNFDTNSRLCMASAVAGYKTSFGSDGPP